MFERSITDEKIKELPLERFPGEIIIIDRPEDVDPAINYLRQFDTIGFDTETKPSFRKGKHNNLSLIQLSTEDKAFLFRVNKIGFPDSLVSLLSDENIKKVGADVNSDLSQMRRLRQFKPQGFIDLQKYAKNFGIESLSLKKLAAIVLGIRISKRQRLSNWENPQLSEGQALYAATDAWVSLMIYKKMKEEEEKK